MVKFKNRYLLAEIVPDPQFAQTALEFSSKDIYRSIWDALCSIYGDFGAGACKQTLHVKLFNDETRIALVRIGRQETTTLTSIVPFVSKIGKTPAALRTIHIGGSVRSCEKALLRFHKLRMVASLPLAKNIEEKKRILAALKKTNAGI